MTYFQTLIDDFNDNAINTGFWNLTDSADLSETGGHMTMHATAGYAAIRNIVKNYDITAGILAMKVLANTGTAATTSVEFGFGVLDDAGNEVYVNSTPTNAWWDFQYAGSATGSGATGEGAGLGTSWTAGNWMGLGNLGSDNILHFYKSSDGQTWTEIGHVTVGGTFHKTTVGIETWAGCFSGTSTYTAVIDDVSYWSQTAPLDTGAGFSDVM